MKLGSLFDGSGGFRWQVRLTALNLCGVPRLSHTP